MINTMLYDDILLMALKEDIGTGDITTQSTISQTQTITGRFIAKEDGVICGLEVCRRVFELIDKDIDFSVNVKDGDSVIKGIVIAQVSGRAYSILTGERTALNFLQHLSGIATRTNYYAKMLKGIGAKIADTRKTTPGMRVLEKYAVKIGGGSNHRYNLSDGVLIKDNHIAAAGGITNAVKMARENIPHTVKIEVETESLKEVAEALEVKADIIMLDNMDIKTMREAVTLINKRALVEASGNMDSKDLSEVAGTGVDIISMGALTHSVKSMDISLKFDKLKA